VQILGRLSVVVGVQFGSLCDSVSCFTVVQVDNQVLFITTPVRTSWET